MERISQSNESIRTITFLNAASFCYFKEHEKDSMAFIGELSALTTAFLWTGSALCFAAATTRVGSVYVNIARLMVAIVFLVLTILLAGIEIQISLRQILFLSLSGLVGFVFGDTFLFKSYEYVSARIGSLIMSAAPAIAAILAFSFLGETLSLLGMVGMLITLAGIALVVLERKDSSQHHIPVSRLGIFYAFLGAIGQAGGLIFAKQAFELGPVNGFVATTVRAVAATAVLWPMNFYAGRFSKPREVFGQDRKALWTMVAGAISGPYLGVTFSLIAIAHTKVAIAATIMAIVPILMLPTVWFLFKERLSWRAITGACVAVAGVAVLFLR
jgi:drug/metabolite transporter (DMT)-like permease